MEQKPIYAISAIVSALFLSGVVTMAIPYVMACISAPGDGYACMSTQQHATIQPVTSYWSHQGFGCDYCTNNDCSNAFVTTPHIQTVDTCNGIGNCNGSPGGGSGNSGGGDSSDVCAGNLLCRTKLGAWNFTRFRKTSVRESFLSTLITYFTTLV